MHRVPIKQLDIVTIYDPARSRESEYKGLARHAVLTAGMDEDYNIYTLDSWADRVSLDNVLIEIERQCDMWKPRCVGVESVAAQATVADIVYTWIDMKHNIAPLFTDLRPDTRIAKRWRIKMQLQRVAPYGKLYILPHQFDLKSELLGFPNSRTIDLCDVLAYAIEILNPPMVEEYSSMKEFARGRAHDQGLNKAEYESDDVYSPLSRVPKIRRPPKETPIIYRRAG